MVEVFSPDDPGPRGGGLEPTIRGRRGLPRWALLVAGVAALALTGAIVTAASDGDDGARGDEPAVIDPAESDAATGPSGAPGIDPASPAGGAGPYLVETAQFRGRAGTRVPMLDGSEVLVLHPPGMDAPRAEVRLLASAWPRGMEDCCRRQILATPVPATQVIGDATPVLELGSGDPGGAVLVDGRTQLLVIDAGDWTVSVLARPDKPFSTSELELYDRLLDVDVRSDGPPTVSARPPLVVGGAMAGLRLHGQVSLGATIFDSGPDGQCGTDDDFGSVFSECALGFQIFGFYDSDSDLGAPDLAVSVARAPVAVPVGAPWSSVAGPSADGPPEPVTARGTRILGGGPGSGVVAGVSEIRNAVSWTIDLGDSAFVSPVTVGDTVLAAPAYGSLVAIDGEDGTRLWELPLERSQAARPLAVAEGRDPDEPLVVVPTTFEDTSRPPVVYGVGATGGYAYWATELPGGTTVGPWTPVVTGDRVVVSGIAVYDNRDAVLVVHALTTDGELVWSHAVEPSTFTDGVTPVVGADTVALVRDGPNAIDALDATTGEVLWRHETDMPVWRLVPDGDAVEVVHLDETSATLDLRTGEPSP